MAAVKVEQADLDSLVLATENLSSAVESFLAANPAIPAAQLEPLQQALADAQQAQTDLAGATPPAPAPTPAPDQPPV